jgi:hypothetical protein
VISQEKSGQPSRTDRPIRQADLQRIVSTGIGQTERDFRKTVNGAGFTLRVGRRNGKPQAGTRENRTDRVTVQVDNGIIVKADIG